MIVSKITTQRKQEVRGANSKTSLHDGSPAALETVVVRRLQMPSNSIRHIRDIEM